MPGNIFHYFEHQSKCETRDDKAIKEKKGNTRYDYDITFKDVKPKLTMNERVVKVCKALSNDFNFDMFY